MTNEFLLNLFRSHGIDAIPQEDWILFPGRNMRARGDIFKSSDFHAMVLQLDVRLEIGLGRTIVESCAGMGETHDQAVVDALRNFTDNSFHVLLAAFFDTHHEQVTQEEWIIGGRATRVTLGNVTVKGQPPVEGEALVHWFGHFTEKCQDCQLPPGTHWARVYYCQNKGTTLECEVLLDNVAWEEMRTEMATIDWPIGEDFYSVRIFLVLEVEKGGTVTPETAVKWLADIISYWENFTDKEVYAALAEAGVPQNLVTRTYLFTQIAWGRAIVSKMGVGLSPDYICFSAEGEIVESGLLADDPSFHAASLLTEKYVTTPGFKTLALMSADLATVNNAVNRGARLDHLRFGPAFIQLEPLTTRGVENFNRAVAQHIAAFRTKILAEKRQEVAAKPWWRFWN